MFPRIVFRAPKTNSSLPSGTSKVSLTLRTSSKVEPRTTKHQLEDRGFRLVSTRIPAKDCSLHGLFLRDTDFGMNWFRLFLLAQKKLL